MFPSRSVDGMREHPKLPCVSDRTEERKEAKEVKEERKRSDGKKEVRK